MQEHNQTWLLKSNFYFYLSSFLQNDFYFYLSKNIPKYLYFYLSTNVNYFLQHLKTTKNTIKKSRTRQRTEPNLVAFYEIWPGKWKVAYSLIPGDSNLHGTTQVNL